MDWCPICTFKSNQVVDTFGWLLVVGCWLVVDTFGGWHKDSLEVITKLGRQVSRQTGKEEDEIVRQLRQRVAILLVRDNVNMFDSRTPSYPQAVIDADVGINV